MQENELMKMSKMHRIVDLCEEPRRFSELKKMVGISDAGLNKDLKSLQKLGWLEKLEDGRYGLTKVGRDMLPNIRRASSVIGDFRTVSMPQGNPVINYMGLEDEDGRTLLQEMSDALRKYINKHSDRFFTIIVTYRNGSTQKETSGGSRNKACED